MKLFKEGDFPFIVIYKESDIYLKKLLYGLPSYAILNQKSIYDLKEIIEKDKKQYKDFLILEIEEFEEIEPKFQIIIPRKGYLTDVIEEIQDSLMESEILGKYPQIEIKIKKTDINFAKYIKLKIPKIYMKNSEFYPILFKKLHRIINKTVKKALYRFSINYTTFKPIHYFEIGRKKIPKTYLEIDKKISDITDRFDFLLLITPINIEKAWEIFKKSKFKKLPELEYRPKNIDPILLKREIFNLKIEEIDDPVFFEIFLSKIKELDTMLSMLQERKKKNFFYLNLKLFGQINNDTLKVAKEILKIQDNSLSEEENLSAKDLKNLAEQEINFYQKESPDFKPKVEIRDDIVSKAMVSNGNLLINKNAKFSYRKIKALLNHEIGTHMLTYHNGKKQPLKIFHTGLSNYEELQEGIAVFSELASNTLDISRLKTLAARVVASDMFIKGKDFKSIFHELIKYNIPEKESFTITTRIFRGGGYTKDAVYLKGFIKFINILKKEENPEIFFIGKFSFEHIDFVKELYFRKILKEPVLKPNYLNDEIINRIRNSKSILELINEN